MPRIGTGFFLFILMILYPMSASPQSAPGNKSSSLPSPDLVQTHKTRQSPGDLEVGGDLAGLPPGSTRYLTREELLALPQVNFTVTDDPNFTGPTKVGGVELLELARLLGASPASEVVVAICDDKYRANYPSEYMAAHHPVLILTVNGQPPAGWPKDSNDHKYDMGPYMISHPKFTPSFKILSHADEAQIPWGVVRLEFRNQKNVIEPITPRGMHAHDTDVQAGFRIAGQNCFRCHNAGLEGGQKSGVPWKALSAMATASPEKFKGYVRDPLAMDPRAQMPDNKNYDEATLRALTAYFRTFSSSSSRSSRAKP